MALRIVFLGSDAIALPCLEWLAGEGQGVGEVVGVYTQPDRPSGRGQQVTPNAIKQWALGRGLPVRQPDRLNPAEQAALAEFKADVALVMAYGHILKDEFIATPRLGTLNLHASLLPRYRGASPIQTAVASGDSVTGVTLMRIVRALDAGPVADEERVPIQPLNTAAEVEARMARACVPLVARALPRLAAGQLEFREQDHAAATYCRRLTKADGALDFTRPAVELAARINGLYPWPGCRCRRTSHCHGAGHVAGPAAPAPWWTDVAREGIRARFFTRSRPAIAEPADAAPGGSTAVSLSRPRWNGARLLVRGVLERRAAGGPFFSQTRSPVHAPLVFVKAFSQAARSW